VSDVQVSHLIGGAWVGTNHFPVVNPADPADLVARVARGTADDVRRAVSTAQEAQPGWAALTAPERGAILIRAADLLDGRHGEVSRDLTREEGKTLAEAGIEVTRAANLLRYYGGLAWRETGVVLPSSLAQTHVYTQRFPVGVVGIITPWNFPIAIPTWKLAPALVTGNAVVLKPAELTPVSTHHLARCLTEAGLPDGVLNVVNGSGSVVGEELVGHTGVAAVSFTGSVSVGQHIHTIVTGRGARILLEMGGKTPFVVLDDADPTVAARLAAHGGFGLTGQACTATSRVIATPGIADQLADALRDEAERYQPGNGLMPEVLMGPVVSGDQLESNQAYLEAARAEGADVFGGGHLGGTSMRPAVLDGVRSDHRVAQEEIFGPVISVIRVDDYDEALRVSNSVKYGLSAAIVTHDISAALHFAHHVEAGIVRINRSTTGVDLNTPFGGIKASSTNTYREQGVDGLDFYTWSKSIYLGYDNPR
jgi:aldehyde dehydrogenase (NAD+)